MMSEPAMRIEFCLSPVDRGLLSKILQELQNSRPNCERCVQQMGDAVERCVASAHPVDAVPPATAEDVAPAEPPKRTRKKAEPVEEPKPEPAIIAAIKTYTKADVTRLVQKLCTDKKTAEARPIVAKYALMDKTEEEKSKLTASNGRGPGVSDISEKYYTELMAELEAL